MMDYGAKEIAQAKAQFDREYLERRSNDAMKDLERITQEIIGYQAALAEQIKVIEGTTFKNYVYIHRNQYDKPITYTVYGIKLPMVPMVLEQITEPEKMGYFFFSRIRGYSKIKVDGFEVYPPMLIYTEGGWGGKKFTGQERRAALAYAEDLAKKDGAEIVKFGF